MLGARCIAGVSLLSQIGLKSRKPGIDVTHVNHAAPPLFHAVTEYSALGTTASVVSHDATRWRAVAPLFPDFAVTGSRSRRETRRQSGTAARRILIGEAIAAQDAARISRRVPVWAVVPGLLRLPRFGVGTPWLSGTVPHRAEGGASMGGWAAEALAEPRIADRPRALAAMDAIVTARIGGSFWAPPVPGERPFVLLCAGPGAAPELLAPVLARHRAAELLVLADHAPAFATAARRAGCAVCATPADPWSAIERARAIHVVADHEIGVLARFAGRSVHVHGTSWLRTADDVADIAAAVLLAATRYADPYTGQPISGEAAVALLAGWRDLLHENGRVACCVGMSHWKRARMAAFFFDGQRAPAFRRTARGAIAEARRRGGAIAVWNSRTPPALHARARDAGVAVLRVEDGFIRSAGLGSDFLPPCSVIADGAGIYYDPSRPSDLETILATTEFDAALVTRAAQLVALLLAQGVTKYAASGTASPLRSPAGQRVLLVPGQVADDLSVRLGGGAVQSNLALLETVRAGNPDAYIVYKPHPDVEAGHRPGVVAPADIRRLADHVVRGGAMATLIGAADEVHTMTSLAGFEAVLRRRAVHVYGQPFYAGWGLTHDHVPAPDRRGRDLNLEELAAGVLILYPRYHDPLTGLPCGPEVLIARMAQPDLWRPGLLSRARQLQGRLRRRLAQGASARPQS